MPKATSNKPTRKEFLHVYKQLARKYAGDLRITAGLNQAEKELYHREAVILSRDVIYKRLNRKVVGLYTRTKTLQDRLNKGRDALYNDFCLHGVTPANLKKLKKLAKAYGVV